MNREANTAKFQAKNAKRRATKASMEPKVYARLRAFRRGKYTIMVNGKPVTAINGNYPQAAEDIIINNKENKENK